MLSLDYIDGNTNLTSGTTNGGRPRRTANSAFIMESHKQVTDSNVDRPRIVFYIGAYFLTLCLFLYFSVYPESRSWGLSVWAYHPFYVQLAYFAAGALAPAILTRTSQNYLKKLFVWILPTNRAQALTRLLILTGFAVVFYTLRSKAHFLGDGYTLLSQLSSDLPLVKGREIGESLLHVWVKDLLSFVKESPSLASYQLLSIVSGTIFVAVLLYFAKRRFHEFSTEVIFVIGTATCGFSLLSFGYVENYSVFALSIAVFCLIGFQVARRELHWLWIIPSLAMSSFLHILGVTMIPAALYIAISSTELGRNMRRMSCWKKWITGGATFTVITAIFLMSLERSLFFKLSLVPLTPNIFTHEGYTLFSANHLLDIFNLLMLLFPPLLLLFAIAIAETKNFPLNRLQWSPEFTFLGLALIGGFGATFVFDPKLGMPRDWDLFAFAGIPLSMLYYIFLLGVQSRESCLRPIALLSIFLAVLSLAPRVISQTEPEIALLQFQNYARLDVKKNRNAGFLETKYLYSIGDSARAKRSLVEWNKLNPELRSLARATSLMRSGNTERAIGILRECSASNPRNSEAWAKLGICFLQQKALDSAQAYLEIADALNPYSAEIQNNLGVVAMKRSRLATAEEFYLKSLEIDTTLAVTYLNLADVYLKRRDFDTYHHYMILGTSKLGAPAWASKELGDYYISINDNERARRAYDDAISKGFDSLQIESY